MDQLFRSFSSDSRSNHSSQSRSLSKNKKNKLPISKKKVVYTASVNTDLCNIGKLEIESTKINIPIYHQALLIVSSNSYNEKFCLHSEYNIVEYMGDHQVYGYQINIKKKPNSESDLAKFDDDECVWEIMPNRRQIYIEQQLVSVREIIDIMKLIANQKKKRCLKCDISNIEIGYCLFCHNCQDVANRTMEILFLLNENQMNSMSLQKKRSILMCQNSISKQRVLLMAKVTREWKNQIEVGPQCHYALLLVTLDNNLKKFQYHIVEYLNDSIVYGYQIKMKNEPINLRDLNKFDDETYVWEKRSEMHSIYLKKYNITVLEIIKLMQTIANLKGEHHLIDNNCQTVTREITNRILLLQKKAETKNQCLIF